jgi:hypothetical protein
MSSTLPVIVTKACKVCSKLEDKLGGNCKGCKQVYYCSKECQKSHWKVHKPICQNNQKLKQQTLLQAGKEIELKADNPITRYAAKYSELYLAGVKAAAGSDKILVLFDELPHQLVKTEVLHTFIGPDSAAALQLVEMSMRTPKNVSNFDLTIYQNAFGNFLKKVTFSLKFFNKPILTSQWRKIPLIQQKRVN